MPDKEEKPEHGSSREEEFHLLDIDGALAHYLDHRQPLALKKDDLKPGWLSGKSLFADVHKNLINKILPKDILLSGSTRISVLNDVINMTRQHKGTLSLTDYLTALQRATGATLDKFLLGDVYPKKQETFSFHQPGHSWDEIGDMYSQHGAHHKHGEKYLNSGVMDRSFHDSRKRLLIYGIVQYLVNKYDICVNKYDICEDKPRTINFYDDNLEILQTIKAFYQQNPDLLPRGVTLKLWQYAALQNHKLHEIATIEGTGVKHPNFYGALQEVAKKQDEEWTQWQAQKDTKDAQDLRIWKEKGLGKSDLVNENTVAILKKFGTQEAAHKIVYHNEGSIAKPAAYTPAIVAPTNYAWASVAVIILIELALFSLIGVSASGELGVAEESIGDFSGKTFENETAVQATAITLAAAAGNYAAKGKINEAFKKGPLSNRPLH
jgi:hypothetical protein